MVITISIIFNKSFSVLKRFEDTNVKSQNSRIYNLLKMAGLDERIWQDKDISLSYIENDTWKMVNKRMQKQRETSISWLKEALENECL